MTPTQRKAELILAAWTSLAPDAVFGGFTRSMFEAIAANGAARSATRLAQTEARRANIAARNAADVISGDAIQRVVWSVLGNPDFGPASALYVAMGYEQSLAPTDLLNYGREVGEGWTPDVLLPRFWMDAARPGAVGGGLIRDRSIYGHHLTPFGPVSVDQIGGTPSISLPPQSWLRNDTLVLNPAFTIVMVGRHYSNSGIRHYFDSGLTGVPVRITMRHIADTQSYQVVTRGINEGDGDVENFRTPQGQAILGTEPWMVVITSNANESSFRLNGGSKIHGGVLGAEGFRGLFIGRRWLENETAWFNGSLGELLILSGVQSPENIARLEGYTAWKWLIAEKLPSGHPYAYTKPQK